MVVCSVPGCAAKGTRMFYSFPKNEAVREIWMKNTKTEHLTEKQLNSYGKICKYHFRESDFEMNPRGQKSVKKGAVPTVNLPDDLVFHDEINYGRDPSDEAFAPRKRQRKQQATESIAEPLANPQHDEFIVDLNDLEIDLQEVVLVDQNQYMTVSVAQIKELEKAAEDCKIYEQKIQEYERIVNEMKQNEKQNKSTISKLLKKDQVNQKKVKKIRQALKDEKMQKNSNIMKYLSDLFNPEQLAFFSMQLKNSRKKPNGRRYTSDEKGLAFILYKHSPKNYREMRKIFVLPSKRTLGRYSAQLVFNTGIDAKLFNHIKEKVETMSEIDTYCTLSWDEVSLKAHLDYSVTRDEIDGFVDMLGVRRPDFATHVLTFMIRGIKVPFKQPIGYFFTHGLKHFELAEMIKLMTEAVLGSGLKIMVSTCDQVGVNVKAVHQLMSPNVTIASSGDLLSYEILGTTIIHCFDPPHLIKGIRNNLMTKTLEHRITKRWSISGTHLSKSVKGQRARSANWDHVERLYRYSLQGSTKLLPKITAEHINPNKSKMKVSVATQVFSETYGTMMLKYADNKILPRNYSDTAEILLFFNDLFDSMNGSCEYDDSYNLKGPVTESSEHITYWYYALSMLAKMNFYDKTTGKVTHRTSVLKHFESTVKGYIEICRKCLSLNMTEISIRNMNQDALENFFGCLRSCCQNSSSLIATHYRAAYATTFIKNLSSAHSIKSNCEPDVSKPLLTDLNKFYLNYNNVKKNDSIANDSDTDDDDDAVTFDPLHIFSDNDVSFINNEAMSNVSSSVCDKMLKITKCAKCRKTLETPSNPNDIFNSSPKHPSDIFKKNFRKLLCAVNDILPIVCDNKGLKKLLLEQLDKIEIEKIGCPKHYDVVESNFKEQTSFYGIVTFTKNINDLLSGKNKILPSNYNDIEELAYIFREKKKHIGKHSDILKLN